MSIYLLFLAVWASLVAVSVYRQKKVWFVLAASAAVGLVFVAPAVLVLLKVVPGWGFGVLSILGYALYWVSDVVFNVSPYEEKAA